MEAEDSWKSSDAKLFGAWLLGLALLAIKSGSKISIIIHYMNNITFHLSVSSNSSFSINF